MMKRAFLKMDLVRPATQYWVKVAFQVGLYKLTAITVCVLMEVLPVIVVFVAISCHSSNRTCSLCRCDNPSKNLFAELKQ